MSAQNPGGQVIAEEFVIKVNDIIEAANRIARRFDTHHAELVLLHAFARYSAHHYRTAGEPDSDAQREAFADTIADAFRTLVDGHIRDLMGPAPVASEAGESEPSAGAADETEPSAE